MPRRLVYPPRLFWKITRMSVQFFIQTTLKTFRICCCCCCCCCFAQVVSHFIFTIRILKYGKNYLHLKLLFRCLVFATDQRGIQQVNCAHNITARDVVAFIEKIPYLTCFLNYCRKIMFVFVQMLRRENPNSHVLVTSIRRHLLVKL